MSLTRRDLLKSVFAASVVTSLPHNLISAGPGKLKILVLGGTSFLGPAIVEAAVARGHTVTLFNRGKTNPQLFPQLEKLRGNRFPEIDQGLSALKNRRWDVAIDTCGYFPRVVKASAELLRDSVPHYIYISSISVYSDYSKTNLTESDAVRTGWDPSDEVEKGETYGARKALCEKTVQEIYKDKFMIPRSHVIFGPRNTEDGSLYWLLRFKQGGEILAPNDGEDPVQFTDVHDIAGWVIYSAENSVYGLYNIVGPGKQILFKEFLDSCRKITGSKGNVTWVPRDFLKENNVIPDTYFPHWSNRRIVPGFMQISNGKALAAGLKLRSIEESLREELTWVEANFPAGYKLGLNNAGLTAGREQEVLKLWHSKQVVKS